MSMKDSLTNLRKTLRLDSHHATERFGIITGAFALTFVALSASVATSVSANNEEQASTTAIYTPTFTTSKTNLSGGVGGVFVSEDHTRALVMMQFEGSQAEAMSVNADNYQAFLTGSTPDLTARALANDITGQIVVFGTTGHIGVVLDSPTAFEQQILNLTMRANTELTHTKDDTRLRADLRGDESFIEHDQWRVYVNPGAEGAVVNAALGSAGDEFPVAATYHSLLLEETETNAREAMDTALAQMRVGLTKIDEYTLQMATTSVGGLKIIPPQVPASIDGDTITGVAGDESDPLTLHTDWVAAQGYDFDWRSGSALGSYVADVVPAGQSLAQYLSDKSSTRTESQTFSSRDLEWKLSDGSDLVADHAGAREVMAPLVSVMNNLTQAYKTYYDQKVDYQTALHQALISLEVELTNVEQSTTTNTAEDALLTY